MKGQNQSKHELFREHSSMKTIQIIMAIAEIGHGASVIDVAQITGLNQSTIYRILQELCECRFVEKDEIKKRYSIGVELINLSTQIHTSGYLEKIAQEEIEKVTAETEETTFFVIRDGDMMVYVCKADLKKPVPLRVALRAQVGWRSPLYCTGAGKAILAFMPQKWLDQYIENTDLTRYTDHTLITPEALNFELERIRVEGVAYDRCEFRPDVNCVAAPIFTDDGEVYAAVSVSAPSYRFSYEDAKACKETVLACSRRIMKRLGGNRLI